MIIVSQDKTEIVNFDNITRIYVHKCPNEISDVRCDTVNDLVINLGNYDTEERAKEVLQEIIDRCANWENLKIGKLTGFCSPKYEMPKE